MEPRKSAELTKENDDAYTPGQKAILNLLQWVAWTVAFVALLFFIKS